MRVRSEGRYTNGHRYEWVEVIPDPPVRADPTAWLYAAGWEVTGDGQPGNVGSWYRVTVIAAANPAHLGLSAEWTD